MRPGHLSMTAVNAMQAYMNSPVVKVDVAAPGLHARWSSVLNGEKMTISTQSHVRARHFRVC